MDKYDVSFSVSETSMRFDACNEGDAESQAYDWWYGNVVPVLKIRKVA